jgi:hypothetical protein
MEKPQVFSNSPRAFDAVFFCGSDSSKIDGMTVIVATERRPKNVTYGIVYLLVSILFGGTEVFRNFGNFLQQLKLPLKLFVGHCGPF